MRRERDRSAGTRRGRRCLGALLPLGIALAAAGAAAASGPRLPESVAGLPPTTLPAADPPVYFEPQAAFRLGAPLPLAGFERVRIAHDLPRSALRILLDPASPRSLIAHLRKAGFAVEPGARYTGAPDAGVIELYLHDLSQAVPAGPLPVAVAPFARMDEEGYVLVAEATAERALRIVIGAKTAKGLFRGGTTAQRLLLDDDLAARRGAIEPVVVLDHPDHPFRGSSPSWAPMTSNYDRVPEPTLDMLDALARAGATAVDWMPFEAAQQASDWEARGARAAALVQVAAAERFMDVHYFMGGMAVNHGNEGPPEVPTARLSLDQVPFADGLGVLREPFAWVETSPGRFQAMAERQGTLHGREPGPRGRPWRAARCAGRGWRPDGRPGRARSGRGAFRLDGAASDCALVEPLDVAGAFGPGRYFLGAHVKASADAAGIGGRLALEIDRGDETHAFSVPIPAALASDTWTAVTLAIPALGPDESAPVTGARLAVRASIERGSLWVDDVTLHEWSRETLPFGGFERAEGWRLGDDEAGGFSIDASSGRVDTSSLRIETPLAVRKKQSARIVRRTFPLRLQPGRYVLGGWIQVDRPRGAPPPKRRGRRERLPVHVDVGLYLFDAPPKRGRSRGDPLGSEFLGFPRRVAPGPREWRYQAHVFDVTPEVAARARGGRLQIRVFQQSEPVTIRIDDVHLRRLDGDLRNVFGAVRAPVLTAPSGTRYVEGEDYEVCQVGARERVCTAPANYTVALEGGLAASYDAARPPFEIRWLRPSPPAERRVFVSYDVGAQYASVGLARRAWDGQLVTSSALNYCDVGAVSSGIDLPAIFGRFLDGYEIADFPRRGETYTFRADVVTWGVSEVRGMNRSAVCLGDDGRPTRTNAALFADVVNHAVRLARSRHPGVRFFLWDDMLNPFTNGGVPDYQVPFGGFPGRSACSVSPGSIPSLCADEVDRVPEPIVLNEERWDEGIVMQPWSYPPNAMRRMVATASWYEGLGTTSQVLSGASPVNVEDWAGIANAFDGIEGVVGTNYFADRHGGKSGLVPALHRFWNHDWKLLHLHDSETPASSHYQVAWPFMPTVTLEAARATTDGGCAVFTSKFAGNNDGGICLDAPPAEPRITLGGVRVRPGARYRIDVMARRARGSRGAPAKSPPTFRVRWSGGEITEEIASTLVFDATELPRPDWFDRYRVEVAAPAGAASMQVEIGFGTAGESVAADDIVIFESTDACLDDSAACAVAPGSAPTPQQASAPGA